MSAADLSTPTDFDTRARAAAERYVRVMDFIRDESRNLAGNGFLAGAAWGREQGRAEAFEEAARVIENQTRPKSYDELVTAIRQLAASPGKNAEA